MDIRDRDGLMESDEVAAYIGVPTSWVRARARRNEIPCVRLGHYVRFRREAIDDWIRDNELSGGRRVEFPSEAR